MKKQTTNVKWELYCDHSFFDLWAVRPVNDKDFTSPRLFHFVLKEEAEQFKELIEKAHLAIPH